jgi:hypothetical protein
MKHYFKPFIFSILVCTSLISKLQAAPVVGFVYNFNCLPDVYTLTRNGQTLPVKFNTSLQKGDQITVNDKNIIELRYEQKISAEPQTPHTVGAQPFLVAEITSIACPIDAYSVKRNGQTLAIPPTVSVGDQIVVDKDYPRIQLMLDGEKVEVNQKNSPYTVKLTDQGFWPRLMGKIGGLITELRVKNLQASLNKFKINTRGIDDKPSAIPAPYIDLLSGRKQKTLVAGTRPLYLAWKGGKASYKLSIQQVGKKAPILSKYFQEQRIKTPDLDLTVGDYRLQICDAREKCSKDYRFTVVDKSELPDYPDELTDIPEASRLTAQAVWLAAQKRNKWAFEAYQQIAPLAESEPPARLVRDALEMGKRIKLPKK